MAVSPSYNLATLESMTAYHHRTVFVGDIKTHFLEAGQGPDLVLLHGGEYGASAEITWKHNIAPLAERFHVIAPDMLGWGGTDKIYNFSDPAGYRINHLRRLLDLLGIHQAFFVGNSAGGGTILRAAVWNRRPFRSRKWSPFAAMQAFSRPTPKPILIITRRLWRT